jgi:hypothetical protein
MSSPLNVSSSSGLHPLTQSTCNHGWQRQQQEPLLPGEPPVVIFRLQVLGCMKTVCEGSWRNQKSVSCLSAPAQCAAANPEFCSVSSSSQYSTHSSLSSGTMLFSKRNTSAKSLCDSMIASLEAGWRVWFDYPGKINSKLFYPWPFMILSSLPPDFFTRHRLSRNTSNTGATQNQAWICACCQRTKSGEIRRNIFRVCSSPTTAIGFYTSARYIFVFPTSYSDEASLVSSSLLS